VTSPTFTIGHRYRGAVPVSHLDLYRFEDVSDAEWGDLEPYFDGAVVFVEWPEAGAGVLPSAYAVVRLEHLGGDRRLLTIDAPGPIEADLPAMLLLAFDTATEVATVALVAGDSCSESG
jgi:tRNA threonylcarbamoyladenosine biosynthesis protein TsaE